MAAPNTTIGDTQVSATTDSANITITDADYFLVKAIQDLTESIRSLRVTLAK